MRLRLNVVVSSRAASAPTFTCCDARRLLTRHAGSITSQGVTDSGIHGTSAGRTSRRLASGPQVACCRSGGRIHRRTEGFREPWRWGEESAAYHRARRTDLYKRISAPTPPASIASTPARSSTRCRSPLSSRAWTRQSRSLLSGTRSGQSTQSTLRLRKSGSPTTAIGSPAGQSAY